MPASSLRRGARAPPCCDANDVSTPPDVVTQAFGASHRSRPTLDAGLHVAANFATVGEQRETICLPKLAPTAEFPFGPMTAFGRKPAQASSAGAMSLPSTVHAFACEAFPIRSLPLPQPEAAKTPYQDEGS
ncbi:ubiquitin-specific protease [Moesziomyces antarcticus T-34]|uniref:Ubiquitin-specific protease n=1 Tax=Pseudozyma antarctica (strain T-34) TaxID=1151754 RepID=M9LTT2_PSEA3|nr:ubiquitin-specific protease [Moesziomyces antarcticus T-34]